MRESWKEVKLGSIAPYWTKKIEAELLNEHNFISADNMRPDKGGITSSDYVPTSGKATHFSANDILVSNIRPYFKKIWFSKNDGGCSNDVIVFRAKPKAVDPQFLYYCLSKDDFFDYMMAGSNGTKMPRGNKKSIPDYSIHLPPLLTQRKIATILSAYDDLIENNLKRIKFLEEKAQLTYEEWFVRMKFPGHETAVFDEESGLPVGWERKALPDVVDINPKTTIKKGTIAPFVPMGSLSENSMVIEPIEERAVSGGMKFKNGDTLFARITPCLENGKTGFVQFMENDCMISTGSTEYIVLRETESCGKYFIYCTARDAKFRENAIKSMVGSDGRQRVKPDCFDKYFVNYALIPLRTKFERLSAPIFRSIQTFVDQNNLLKESRDILLPRLMTGLIDVDEIEQNKLNLVLR